MNGWSSKRGLEVERSVKYFWYLSCSPGAVVISADKAGGKEGLDYWEKIRMEINRKVEPILLLCL